jgi:Prokaryotic E2 family C/ThiF family
MALAEYFDRGAVAAAQLIAGFDEAAFKSVLSDTTVGVALGPEAVYAEGQHLADLVTRLLARLYPSVAITAAPEAAGLAATLIHLARDINPAIDISNDVRAKTGLVIGSGTATYDAPVYLGSDGWIAFVRTNGPAPVGKSQNPFGAGAAACLGCANVFRLLFNVGHDQLDHSATYSTYSAAGSEPGTEQADLPTKLPDGSVLIGAGAIGNAAAWALARTPMAGRLHLVDPEAVELSNLQRYVLAGRDHVGRVKVDLLADAFANGIESVSHEVRWADFAEQNGYDWRYALVALDSAADRRAVQAALPERILNAWTQPGDLGVSHHGRFSGAGACLCCLYLPSGEIKSEDRLVAEALAIPEHEFQVRELLYSGAPAPPDLLDLVAERLGVSRDALSAFTTRSVRELYVEGVCGGAVLPLNDLPSPQHGVHVPLAHQSALAGVLLAASFARDIGTRQRDSTEITRIDLMRPLGTQLRQPALKGDRRCVCADHDYLDRYLEKWDQPLQAVSD